MELDQAIEDGETRLSEADPVMAELIRQYQPMTLTSRGDYFESLSRTIVGQQVSVAAARSIYERFEQSTKLDPLKIESMEIEELRELGLSRQKAGYIRDLAAHFVEDRAVFNHLEKLEDEAIIEELTDVKGVGRWTAQMFLMFTLNRIDVFAPDDLGLQRAVGVLYPKEPLRKPREFASFAERWKPYRTVASWYLWKSIDTTPYK